MSEWMPYLWSSPPRDALCVFRINVPAGRQWVGTARELPPWFNVANLEWKLTGIAKENGYDAETRVSVPRMWGQEQNIGHVRGMRVN